MITGPMSQYPCRSESSDWWKVPTTQLHSTSIQPTITILLTFGSCRRTQLCIFQPQHRVYQRLNLLASNKLTSPLFTFVD